MSASVTTLKEYCRVDRERAKSVGLQKIDTLVNAEMQQYAPRGRPDITDLLEAFPEDGIPIYAKIK